MLHPAAETAYDQGLKDFAEGRRAEALKRFEAAIELSSKYTKGSPQPRYLSHYGLCLALVKNELRDAICFCKEAVIREGYNAEMHYNLGRVLMRAGRRREAHESLAHGLRLQPNHQNMRRLLQSMGVRKRPALPFLDRRNPLNVLLGRLRSLAA